jgi:hypothetical protein
LGELANVVTVHTHTHIYIYIHMCVCVHSTYLHSCCAIRFTFNGRRIECAVPTYIHQPSAQPHTYPEPNASFVGLLREFATNKKPKSPNVVDLHFLFSSVYVGSCNFNLCECVLLTSVM